MKKRADLSGTTAAELPARMTMRQLKGLVRIDRSIHSYQSLKVSLHGRQKLSDFSVQCYFRFIFWRETNLGHQ